MYNYAIGPQWLHVQPKHLVINPLQTSKILPLVHYEYYTLPKEVKILRKATYFVNI
jgi:hypothetical protein